MAPSAGRYLQRPAVGVTGNSKRLSPSWLCTRLALRWAGAKAVRICVGHTIPFDRLSAFVIGGGDDIHPTLYGALPIEGTRYDRKRDKMEIECIRFALNKQLPLLGICRGHQLINTVRGGRLYTSIRSVRRKTSNKKSLLPRKRVRVLAGSQLESIVKKSYLYVNSLHQQAVSEVAAGLVKVAIDKDQIVQGVESRDGRPILGVQWHPEYLWFVPSQMRLFRWLAKRARVSMASQKIL